MARTAPMFNPIAFSIGPIDIRWYALAYMFGFLIAYFLFVPFAQKQLLGKDYNKEQLKTMLDDLLLYTVLGVVLGGRLGYVLFYVFFYDPAILIADPLMALRIWDGGMSFHGGLFGVLFACALYCIIHRKPYLKLMDILALLAPIGLFLGRIANFVNGELWGRPTDVPWAMIFSHANDGIARHPSQLYEAALEGILLFVILFICSHFQWFKEKAGRLSALFLLGYGLARFIVEFFREPNEGLGNIIFGLTMGQTLTLSMFIIAFILIIQSFKKEQI
ncbi:MAG: prolipoprotein diacylglyceryl transferase [Alphaproteobacteria bacterium]